MNGFNVFFEGLNLLNITAQWAQEALADGRVDVLEGAELGERLSGPISNLCNLRTMDGKKVILHINVTPEIVDA